MRFFPATDSVLFASLKVWFCSLQHRPHSHKADNDEAHNTFKMSYTCTVKHAGCCNSFHGCLMYPLRKSMTFTIQRCHENDRVNEETWGDECMNLWSLRQTKRQSEKNGRRQPLNTWAISMILVRSAAKL